ncbi:LptF/LptG family permease [Acetobacter sp. TBRC 12305]|uniref:LptF/LptG family permease n=1 Tax=Acetobacter garciniae TaxID=2817435 RepID=A0A939KMY2_9PROT|nr:LptF/LptG family permease [Acetobacter garciniae]MBO1325793.1 LptF/LptG family permease [Acetobacter garciniae]MBX0345693.1 LptF/LptG family permease [Acetobacter garciniae]
MASVPNGPPPSLPATPHGWLRQLCVRQFMRSVLWQAGATLLLVEAIFLAERFPMIFRDVISHHANLFDAGLIFLLTGPQILDFALPLAMIVAVYRTALTMRENRELLVLSACGLAPRSFILPPIVLAVAALLLSLAASGVVNPLALYAQRAVLFDAAYRNLITATGQSQLVFVGNRVAFIPQESPQKDPPATISTAPMTRRNLFVYEPLDPTHFRVVQSGSVRTTGSAPENLFGVSVAQMTSHIFSVEGAVSASTPGQGTFPNLRDDEQMTFYADTADKIIPLDDILPFPPRWEQENELTLPELLVLLAHHATQANEPSPVLVVRLLGERLSRGLLCLLAPLVALAALSQTTQRNRSIALPASCMALLAFNVGTESLIRAVAPSGLGAELVLLLLLTATLQGLLLAALRLGISRLLLPQLLRA